MKDGNAALFGMLHATPKRWLYIVTFQGGIVPSTNWKSAQKMFVKMSVSLTEAWSLFQTQDVDVSHDGDLVKV